MQGVREPDWEKKIKRDIPEFLGTDSSDEIIDWLTLVNEVFEHRNVPEEHRVGIIAMRFRGKAIAWWRRDKQTCHSAGKDPITQWRKMEDKIWKYFLPKRYKRDSYQRYQNLRQDLGDAHQRALKVERSRSRKPQSTSFTNRTVQGSVDTTKASNTSAHPTGINKAPAHPNVSNQPLPIDQSSTTSMRCYSCGKIGHRASNCRKRQAGKALLVKNESDDPGEEYSDIDPKDDESNSEDEQVLNSDIIEFLMMRTNFLTLRQETGNHWLRNNIFHSACTVSKKVCRLIIDSYCCEDVISEAATNKLKLELKEYPTPYKMSCLNHIILGRPWQFDKKTTHDGYHNTYSFDYGGKKITLAPSKEPIQTPLVENSPSSNFLVMKDVKGDMQGVSVVYVLLNKSDIGDVVAPIIPNQVQPLLEEFKDVFTSYLPSGLPPMRDIQHQIDLMPGASLPILAHYRISPVEHEEQQRQVMELLNMGFIRESLSPCAVPALLVLKPYLGHFVVVYFDDILIYSKTTNQHLQDIQDALCLLRQAHLFATPEKCYFMVPQFLFLGFNISREGISVDDAKIKKSIFEWTIEAQRSFEQLKKKLCTAPVLALPNFDLIFEVHCDASGTGIGGVVSQGGRPIAFFKYLQDFTFNIKHKGGVQNQVADALSRKKSLLNTMRTIVLGFDSFQQLYMEDEYFSKLISDAYDEKLADFTLRDGFLFKGNHLCVPDCSLRQKVIGEIHNEGHFCHDKTLQLVSAKYYWPHQKRDVYRYVMRCQNCQIAKGQTTDAGCSPFVVIYGRQPKSALDLAPIPFAEKPIVQVEDFVSQMKLIHEDVHRKMKSKSETYKKAVDKRHREVIFEPEDFVWAYLPPERHPFGSYNKLSARKLGPLEVLALINPNAYRLKLPSHMKIYDVFNVRHLTPYMGDSTDDDASNS
ncbi:uncharacterized protein LOC143883121 [Tasmannia lanceolata]|uniref:uncharacterized protein LOC143883121 n=1 Tax=Tasmannia lanceolata TaxID=3420 RepID=UPI004062CDC8